MLLVVGLAVATCRGEPRSQSKPVWPGEAGEQAWSELGAFYASEKAEPPGIAALTQLSSSDPRVATNAGNYITALFAQAKADENNGRAEWRRTPFWGGSPISRARQFREQLAERFGKQAGTPSAMPPVRWLLTEERLPKAQQAAIDVLLRIRSPEADAYLCDLLAQPHPNAYVLLHAIDEAGRRKLAPASRPLKGLCLSYRQQIREASAAALQKLGERDLPSYSPEQDFSPQLEHDLRSIAAIVYPWRPDGSRWAWVQRAPATNQAFNATAFGAWLVSETTTTMEVVTYFGTHEVLEKSEYNFTVESLADTARRIVEARRAGKLRRHDDERGVLSLSRQGGLTGQFEPPWISAPEAILAAWLFERGQRREAADLLFPVLDKLPDDRWLFEFARDQIGGQLQDEMLASFCLHRDYQRAALIGHHLSRDLFIGYRYRERAIELCAQLTKRGEDFRSLSLPTASEWQKLKAGLDRPSTIRLLADRIRLLKCRQWGQPGGIDYGETQFASPEGTGEKVINPYAELLALKLLPADIKVLLPYLRDQDFILAFSYWRSFHPDRHLHRVSWVVAAIINQAAAQELVDDRAVAALADSDGSDVLVALSRWCDEHASMDHASLNIEVIRASRDWTTWRQAVELAIAEQRTEAAASAMLARQADFPSQRPAFAELVFSLHSAKTLPLATDWVKQGDREVRFWSALAVLDQGGTELRASAVPVIADALAKDLNVDLYAVAVEPLLRDGTPEAIALAVGILKMPGFGESFSRSEVIHRLLVAGRPEAFSYVLAHLDSREPGGSSNGPWDGKEVRRELFEFDTIAEMATRWRTGWEYQFLAPESERLAKVKELKHWISIQAEAVRRGQKTEINALADRPIKGPHQMIDAP